MGPHTLSFREPPVALTARERVAFLLSAIVVALSRWPALSLGLWDWDEALFSLAVRNYDVTLHHPHPPGFPLFIGLAKLLPLDPFHSLQAIAFVGSLLVFPAMFFVAREMRASFPVALSSAFFLAFLPNVWLFGGTAFSDVPSLVLVLFACALLLRGCRSDVSAIAGAVLLGIAAGFRPQNLVIGFAPALLMFLHRRRTGAIAGLIVAAIVAASYAGAASASGGWDAYRQTLTRHERYIRQVDSFLSPIRPGLIQVADDFFLRPFRAPLLNIVLCALALFGLRRRTTWLAAAVFGPFLLFAWLYLDFHSSSRFSIAYMPLFAIAAAEGLPRRGRVASAGAAVVVACMIAWTWPALRIVHTTLSPPVAAIEAIRRLDPKNTIVFVDARLAAHAELLLPEYERRITGNAPPTVASSETRQVVLLREGASTAPGAQSFVRERARLDGIARDRYFAASVMPARRH